MKKRIISMLVVLSMVLAILPTTVFATDTNAYRYETWDAVAKVAVGVLEGESATNADYTYRINSGGKREVAEVYTDAGLAYLASSVNTNGVSHYEKTVYLMNDIDLTGFCEESWSPIGTETTPFLGSFDGNDYTITGLTIDGTANNQGFFGYIKKANTESTSITPTISYLNFKNATVNGGDYIGAVVGYGNYVILDNVTVDSTSSITGVSYVGGLVGYLDEGEMTSCSNDADVSGQMYVGGLIGYFQINEASGASMTYCSNTGTISSSAGWQIENGGGLVGTVTGYATVGTFTMDSCYNTGEINGYNMAGGLIGNLGKESNVTNCYNTGAVSGNTQLGGLFGKSVTLNISDCYNVGSVAGYANIGPIIGNASATPTSEDVYYLESCVTEGTYTVGTSSTALDMTDNTIMGFDTADWTFKSSETEVITTTNYYPYLTANAQSPLLTFASFEEASSWTEAASIAQTGTDFVQDDENETLEIYTATGLAYFADEVNNGTDYSGYTITLENDINLDSGVVTAYVSGG